MGQKGQKGKGSMNARDLGKLLKRHGFRIIPGKGTTHGKILDRKGNVVSTIVVHHRRLLSKSYVGTVVKNLGLNPHDVFA
jgi:gamma-glutamyltranspeptidase